MRACHTMSEKGYMKVTNTKVEQFIPEVYYDDVQRVVLACLKIANGNLQTLKEQLSEASGYWREIIGQAEYPNHTRKAHHIERLSRNEQQAIIELDKSQYLEWLNKS
jgi:hypothetical protein